VLSVDARPVFSMVTYRTIFQVISSRSLDTLQQSYEKKLWIKAALAYRDQAKTRQLNIYNVTAYLVDVFDFLNEPDLLQYYCLNTYNQTADEPHPTLQVKLLKNAIQKRIRAMASTSKKTPYTLPGFIKVSFVKSPTEELNQKREKESMPSVAKMIWTEDASASEEIDKLFTKQSEYANKDLVSSMADSSASANVSGERKPKPRYEQVAKRGVRYEFMNPEASFDQIWQFSMKWVDSDRIKKSDFIGPTLLAFAILFQDVDKIEHLIKLWKDAALVFNVEEYYLQLKFLNTLGDSMLVLAFSSVMNYVATELNVHITFNPNLFYNSVFFASVARFKLRVAAQSSTTHDLPSGHVPRGLTFGAPRFSPTKGVRYCGGGGG